MLSSLKILLLVAVLTPTASVAAPLIDRADLQTAGYSPYWEAHIPLTDRDTVKTGFLVDNALYVVTNSGTIYAVEASVGLIRWAHKLTLPEYTIYSPAHMRHKNGTGAVIFPTTTKVVLFDRYSGDVKTNFTTRFASGSSAVGYGSNLFMGSSDGRFYSLQLGGAGAPRAFKRWEVSAGGPVTGSPILFDADSLLFTSQSGNVFACHGEDKTLIWSFSAGGPISGDPAMDEDGVYVASADRSLYKLDRDNGKLLWRRRMQRPLKHGPDVTAHTVYQFVQNDGLHAIEADTGKTMWSLPNGRAFVARGRHSDVVTTADRQLMFVDHKSGAVQHSVVTHDVVDFVTNTQSDSIYVLGANGDVLCARPSDVPYLKRQQIIAARARLTKPPLNEGAKLGRKSQSDRGSKASATDDPLRSRFDRSPP